MMSIRYALCLVFMGAPSFLMGMQSPFKKRPIHLTEAQRRDRAEVLEALKVLEQSAASTPHALSVPRESGNFGGRVETRTKSDGTVKYVLVGESPVRSLPADTPSTVPTPRGNNPGLDEDQLMKMRRGQEQTVVGIFSVVSLEPVVPPPLAHPLIGDHLASDKLTKEQEERVRKSGQSGDEKRKLQELLRQMEERG